MNLLSFNAAIFIATFVAGVYAADEIQDIADKLKESLSNLVNVHTDYDNLSRIVSNVETKLLEPGIIEKDITNLENLFDNRLSTAKKMVDYAVFVHANHTTDFNLGSDYKYFNARENSSNVEEDPPYFSDIPVNKTKSAVQTPTDVYQYTTEILNSIKWTAKLDEKFIENRDQANITAWQYIGLSNGVFRFFPGRLWPKGSKDLLQHYDVRQRSWYIEGSSSPKDMVIILDLSGSVIGDRLLIIKSAVIHLLNTLQENDFVNIVLFNEKARYLKKCWKHLVQATERNKEILKTAIKGDSVTGKNVANVETGFELAFKILEESNQTSNCTQTIAFFTDGVEGDTVAEDVFDRHNSKKKVRVFTYLVGNENGSPFEAVKWIACSNKGYFYRIKTLSDVRPKIVKYVTVLSRSRSTEPKWTPLFLDALGLGMTSSLVVPIFAKKDQKLIGVLGSDVRLSEILSKFPEPHLGSGGYPFLITNNGLVFYHPLLQTKKGAGLEHPVSIYLSELLHHFDDVNKTEQLAKKMIDREKEIPRFEESDFKEFLVLTKYNNKFRVVKRSITYLYNEIRKTLFSVGIAVTDYGSKQIDPTTYVPNSPQVADLDSEIKELEDKQKLKINIAEDWIYCSKTITNWKELKERLKNKTCKDSQPKSLLTQVLYDITKLGNTSDGWKPTKPAEVKDVFFGTTSGLTFYKSDNNTFSTSIKQEYFERAADSWKEKTIIFSVPNENEVLASRAVVGESGGKPDVLWGVVGIRMDSSVLKKKLEDECKSGENEFCYLVDENGYVVSSEKENKFSAAEVSPPLSDMDFRPWFFGTVEGNIMEDLINQNVYTKYNFTDVQAKCTTNDESSSSVRLLDPFFSLVNYAKWWTQTVALSLIQYSLYTAWTGTTHVKAEDDSPEKIPCFKKIDLYYRSKDVKDARNDSIFYSGCERSYNSSVVAGTNLLLVRVRVNNSTYCKTKVMRRMEQDNYEESCDQVEHYRVPARGFGGTCTPIKKESQECSSGKLLIPSIAVFAVLQLLVLLLQRE